MTRQAQLLQLTVRELAPQSEALATRFYTVLFHRAAHIEPLFRGASMSEQKEKLWSALTAIVGSLSNPTQLTEFLHILGRRHAAYGVRPEHYDVITDALLMVLREFMGEGWTQEHHTAWSAALQRVSTVMCEAVTERSPTHS